MKNIFRGFCRFAVLLVLCSCSEDYIEEEGTGTITGKVVDSETNIPMPYVKIETSPVSNTVFSDDKGNFIIENIKKGDYAVKAELKGYTAAFKGAVVYDKKISHVVFELNVSKANNKPPSKPILKTPVENQIITTTTFEFQWSSKDPDKDFLNYKLTLHNDLNNETEVFDKLSDTIFKHNNLKLGLKYFWQITVDDGYNSPVTSDVSSFSVDAAPKNNRLLFTREVNGNLVIFSTDETVDQEFQLTNSNSNSFRPKRNTAANKIAFLRTTGTYTDLYIMDTDGRNQQKITSTVKPGGFKLNEISFSWPEHSDKIYFSSFDKLYTVNTNGQGLTMVYQTKNGSFISEVEVHTQKNTILLKTNDANGYRTHIYAVDLQFNFLFDVLKNKTGATSGLQISSDGQKIIYAYDSSGVENMDYRRSQSRLFLFDRITLNTTEISTDIAPGTNDLEPRFAPNEAFVIFTNTSNDGKSKKNIFIKELNTLVNTRVLKYKNAFMPDWY